MPVKGQFIQDCGIYGVQLRDGFKTRADSPFIVFKNESGWTIAQSRSGLVISALIPRHVQKSKRVLLEMVAAMETAEPESCEIVGALKSLPWPDDVKPYGRKLIDWAREYHPCI